jgi:hypothetical protein
MQEENKTPAGFFCTLQCKNASMYRIDPIGRNSNLENPIAEFKFWEVKSHWLSNSSQ